MKTVSLPPALDDPHFLLCVILLLGLAVLPLALSR
jgi:hypothetical protein